MAFRDVASDIYLALPGVPHVVGQHLEGDLGDGGDLGGDLGGDGGEM
jgi:hypothetical protein